MPTKSDINHVLSEGYRCLREEKWTEGSLSYLQTASRRVDSTSQGTSFNTLCSAGIYLPFDTYGQH